MRPSKQACKPLPVLGLIYLIHIAMARLSTYSVNEWLDWTHAELLAELVCLFQLADSALLPSRGDALHVTATRMSSPSEIAASRARDAVADFVNHCVRSPPTAYGEVQTVRPRYLCSDAYCVCHWSSPRHTVTAIAQGGDNLKRPRRNTDASSRTQAGNPPFTLDDVLWFEDGSIVSVARDTGFRVYRELLAKRSQVFRDLFARLPSLETVCSLLTALSSTSLILRRLLESFCRRCRSLPLGSFSLRVFISWVLTMTMQTTSYRIRLSHGYDIKNLLQTFVRQLKVLYPPVVFRWTEVRNAYPYSTRAITAVNLARLTETLSSPRRCTCAAFCAVRTAIHFDSLEVPRTWPLVLPAGSDSTSSHSLGGCKRGTVPVKTILQTRMVQARSSSCVFFFILLVNTPIQLRMCALSAAIRERPR